MISHGSLVFMIFIPVLVSLLIGFLTLAILLLMIYSAIRYVPFVPTSSRLVKLMVDQAEIKDGQIVYDLGCGDGRLLIEAKRRKNVQAVGVEAAWWVFMLAKIKRWWSGQKIILQWGNFFEQDLRNADVIFCYLFPKIMKRLEQKFKAELRQGTRIVSLSFPMVSLTPIKTIQTRPDKPKNFLIYVYEI